MRIIIAEDEKRASRGLKNLLTYISEEAEVIAEASDGKKAFELIKALHPDVVFADIRMPYMDGISLIRAVRGLGMNVKFVIVTAYEEFEWARQAITLGVVDYLVKPLTVEDVQEVWNRLTRPQISGAEACKPESEVSLRKSYPDAHPLVLKALDIIQCSYGTKLSQKEVAQKLGISAEYFSFLFSRDIGEPFSRFLRRYRIRQARVLIDSGDVPGEEIPYRVGFTDLKYFCKCFKDETGMSLTEYKRTRM